MVIYNFHSEERLLGNICCQRASGLRRVTFRIQVLCLLDRSGLILWKRDPLDDIRVTPPHEQPCIVESAWHIRQLTVTAQLRWSCRSKTCLTTAQKRPSPSLGRRGDVLDLKAKAFLQATFRLLS